MKCDLSYIGTFFLKKTIDLVILKEKCTKSVKIQLTNYNLRRNDYGPLNPDESILKCNFTFTNDYFKREKGNVGSNWEVEKAITQNKLNSNVNKAHINFFLLSVKNERHLFVTLLLFHPAPPIIFEKIHSKIKISIPDGLFGI